jgi:hypothetical protein
VDLLDLGPLTMEEPILSADLSLGSLPSYDCQVNLTLKFNDLNVDDGAGGGDGRGPSGERPIRD